MSENVINSEWLEQHRAGFIRADSLALQVGDYNQLYADLVESGKVTIEPIARMADEFLAIDQKTVFAELNEVQANLPYYELGQRELELHRQIGEIATQLAVIDSRYSLKAALIDEEVGYVAERLPKLADKLADLSAKLKSQQIKKEKGELEEQLNSLTAEHAAITELYGEPAKQWPLPRLVNSENASDELLIIDEFPFDKDAAQKKEIGDRVRRNYPDEILRDASLAISMLLSDIPKLAFTLDDIANFLYGKEEQRGPGRVSALISSHRNGKVLIIERELKSKGLVLQQGQRTTINKATNKKEGACKVVFRVVPRNHADLQERLVAESTRAKVVDLAWHSLEAKTITRGSEVVAGEDTSRDLTYASDEAYIIDDPEKTSQEVVPAAELPAEEQVQQEEAVNEVLQAEPEVQEKTPSPEREPKWKKEFIAAIEMSILSLHEQGLLESETVTPKILSIKSTSANMGTDTQIDRAIQHGILNKNYEKTSALRITEVILMSVQNKFKGTAFNHKNDVKLAFRLTEEALATFKAERNIN